MGYAAGAYAEYITVSTKMLIRKPQELSWEEAAGIPEVGRYRPPTIAQGLIILNPLTDMVHSNTGTAGNW